MDIREKRIKELNSMVDQENIKCCKTYETIESRAHFLRAKGVISRMDYADTMAKVVHPLIHTYDDYVDDSLTYRWFLSDLYGQVLDIYQQYQKREGPEVIEINDKKIKALFLNFLKYINIDKLYESIKKKGMITLTDDVQDKNGYVLFSGSLSYIVLKNSADKLQLYSTFAHEMGHAFASHVVRKRGVYQYKLPVAAESVSILIQRMFHQYLLDNGLLDSESVESKENIVTNSYRIVTKRAKKSLDLLDNSKVPYEFTGSTLKYSENGKVVSRSLYDNVYAIGNLVSINLLQAYKRDPDYFIQHLPDTAFELYTKSTDFLTFEDISLDALKSHLDKHMVKKI